jgi:hypothetical protein
MTPPASGVFYHSTMAEMFHGALLKVQRANEHINDLYVQCREFSKTRPYRVVVNRNVKFRDSVLQISMEQAAPDQILLVAGDAIHNLRASLDFVMSDIEFDTTNARDTHTHFPIRNTRNELVTAVNGGLKKKAPKAIIDFIVDIIQPYETGQGQPIWALNSLDIEDKHRLLIAKKDIAHIRNIVCKDGRGEKFVIHEWAVIHSKPSQYVCVGHSNVEVTDKGIASIGIVFGDGMPFYGTPILPLLRDLSVFISRTIISLALEYKRIGIGV